MGRGAASNKNNRTVKTQGERSAAINRAPKNSRPGFASSLGPKPFHFSTDEQRKKKEKRKKEKKKKRKQRARSAPPDNVNAKTKSACSCPRVHEHKFLIGLSARSIPGSRHSAMQVSCSRSWLFKCRVIQSATLRNCHPPSRFSLLSIQFPVVLAKFFPDLSTPLYTAVDCYKYYNYYDRTDNNGQR